MSVNIYISELQCKGAECVRTRGLVSAFQLVMCTYVSIAAHGGTRKWIRQLVEVLAWGWGT